MESVHQCVRFSSQLVEIYVNFIRMPPAIFKIPPSPYKILQFTTHSVLPQSVRSLGVLISLVAPKDTVLHLYRITFSCVCCRCATREIHTQYQLENRKTRSTTMFPENFNSIPTTVREIWLDFFRKVPIWYSNKISKFPLAQVSYSFNIKVFTIFQQSHILALLVLVNCTKQ